MAVIEAAPSSNDPRRPGAQPRRTLLRFRGCACFRSSGETADQCTEPPAHTFDLGPSGEQASAAAACTVAGLSETESSSDAMPAQQHLPKFRSLPAIDESCQSNFESDIGGTMVSAATAPQALSSGISDGKFTINSFQVRQLLKQGRHSKVYRVVDKGTNVSYVMNLVAKVGRGKSEDADYLTKALSYVRHPFIVPLTCAFQTSAHLILVSPFCGRGDLRVRLTRCTTLSEALAQFYAAEILSALAHLHSRRVTYGQLQLENVVVDNDGHVMLTDCCRSTRHTAGSKCHHYGRMDDIHDLGAMVASMLLGLALAGEQSRKAVHGVGRDDKPLLSSLAAALLKASEAAAEFVSRATSPDIEKRLGSHSTEHVQRHRYFESIDWTGLLRRDVVVPTNCRP